MSSLSDFIIMNNRVPGTPTRSASDINTLINNDNALFAGVEASGGNPLTVINGGFENGSGSNTAPIGWSLTLFAGGSSSFITGQEGDQAFQFNAPGGGGGTGGGQLESTDFIPIRGSQTIYLNWALLCSNAASSVAVKIAWYDNTLPSPILLSTVTVYSSSSANPTSWEQMVATIQAPSNARQFKIVIIGGNIGSAAGTIAFDNLYFFTPVFLSQVLFSTVGSGNYAQPSWAAFARVKVKGSGGGGASGVDATFFVGNPGVDGGSVSFGSLSCTGGKGGPVQLNVSIQVNGGPGGNGSGGVLTQPGMAGLAGAGGGPGGGPPAINYGTGSNAIGYGCGGGAGMLDIAASSGGDIAGNNGAGGEGGYTEGLITFSPGATTALSIAAGGAGGAAAPSQVTAGGSGFNGYILLDLYGAP